MKKKEGFSHPTDFSQCWSIKVRRPAFLNYIQFADLLILRLSVGHERREIVPNSEDENEEDEEREAKYELRMVYFQLGSFRTFCC